MRLNIFLAIFLSVLTGFSATLPVSMSTTNGVAIGTTTIGGNLSSTNHLATNNFTGKVITGTNVSIHGSLDVSKNVYLNGFSVTNGGLGVIVSTNNSVGIGDGIFNPAYPLELAHTVTGSDYPSQFNFFNNFGITPAYSNLSGQFSAEAAYTTINPGPYKVDEASGVFGSVQILNTNAGNKVAAVIGHWQTEAGYGGAGSVLAAFRSSMDHNSTGTVDTAIGYYAPQLDIGVENGTVTTVAGFQVDNLDNNKAHKKSVYGFRSFGRTQRNFFSGPTGFGDGALGQTNASLSISPDNASTNTTGASGVTNIQLRVAPVYNQSGTAAATDIQVNRSGVVGSGAQYLMDLQSGGFTRFNVNPLGDVNGVGNWTNVGSANHLSGTLNTEGLLTLGTSGLSGPVSGDLELTAGQFRNAEIIAPDGGDVRVTSSSGTVIVTGPARYSSSILATGDVASVSGTFYGNAAGVSNAVTLIAGTNVTIITNSNGRTFTIASSGGGGSGTACIVWGGISNNPTGGTNVIIDYNRTVVQHGSANTLVVATNVGIGTTTPINKLSVDANVTTNGGIASVFQASGSSPNIRGIFLHGGNGSGYLGAGGLQIIAQGAQNSTMGSGDINFFTTGVDSDNGSTDASVLERMTIHYNGNVGIGTTTPGAKLDVNGNVNVTGNFTNTGYIVSTNTTSASPSGMTGVIINGGSNGVNANVINVVTNGVSNFNVTESGNSTNAGNIQSATLNTTGGITAGSYSIPNGGGTIGIDGFGGGLGLIQSNTRRAYLTSAGLRIDTSGVSSGARSKLDVTGDIMATTTITATNGFASYKNATAANTSITVGASPFNYTNTTGVNIFVDIDANGGTTTVGRNGTTVFTALVNGDHEMFLKNGGYLTVTYSIATPIMGYTEN